MRPLSASLSFRQCRASEPELITPPSTGVPCVSHDVREVCGGVVHASPEPEDTLAGATHETKMMHRRGSDEEDDAQA